jgi:glycine/D-amino acid oxidase-like deaminating enzyme
MPPTATLEESYDAIVVGASFAGLAVARELYGRVLLIDHQEIGAGQTSACGTPLRVLEGLGLTEAVHQVHPAFYIHRSDAVDPVATGDGDGRRPWARETL